MGKQELAFRSIIYTIAVLSILFALALLLGFEQFGNAFSFAGFVALAFIIFTTIAE
ncbi:MAG: hypothetical protein WC634_01310 [archaeon]